MHELLRFNTVPAKLQLQPNPNDYNNSCEKMNFEKSTYLPKAAEKYLVTRLTHVLVFTCSYSYFRVFRVSLDFSAPEPAKCTHIGHFDLGRLISSMICWILICWSVEFLESGARRLAIQ